MTATALRGPLLALGLAVAFAAPAQVGHPAKGSWIGYWGPDDSERRRILLLLDWENREISGMINPGRDPVPIDTARIDYETWTMTIEARMRVPNGGTQPWVATGTIENLGSWVNRRWSGTYTHGDETGQFLVTMN